MDRPLWRILLPILILLLGLHRLGLVAVALLGDDGPGVLAASRAVEVVAAGATALGLWLGRPWAAAAILVLAVAIGATALLEGFLVGVRPPAGAVAQLLVAAVGGGALSLLVRRELTHPAVLGDADDPESEPSHRSRPSA